MTFKDKILSRGCIFYSLDQGYDATVATFNQSSEKSKITILLPFEGIPNEEFKEMDEICRVPLSDMCRSYDILHHPNEEERELI